MKLGIYKRLHHDSSWLVTLLEVTEYGARIMYHDSTSKNYVSLKMFEEFYEFVRPSVKDDFEITGEE